MSVSEMLSNICGPMWKCSTVDDYSIGILSFSSGFTIQKNLWRRRNREKTILILASFMSFTKIHFILPSFFKKLFLLTWLFRCCNPALQSTELAHRQATSHGLEQSEKPTSTTTTLKRTISHTEAKSENQNSEKSSKIGLRSNFLLSFVQKNKSCMPTNHWQSIPLILAVILICSIWSTTEVKVIDIPLL